MAPIQVSCSAHQARPGGPARPCTRPARLLARAIGRGPTRVRELLAPSLLETLPRCELVLLLRLAHVGGEELRAENARLRADASRWEGLHAEAAQALDASRLAHACTERGAASAWTSFCGAKHQLLAAQDALAAKETQAVNLQREVRQLRYAAAQRRSGDASSAGLL